MDELLVKLKQDFPFLTFQAGSHCCWSPRKQTIIYNPANTKTADIWAVLHELGHAVLGHTNYDSDFDLLKLEVAAWEKARQLASNYGYKISDEHIQSCLDTYREWLHRRSTCPICSSGSLQQSLTLYHCFNCQTTWRVTTARFCRPYRRVSEQNKKSPGSLSSRATFL